MRRILLALTILLSGCQPQAAAPGPDRWTPVFRDDFDTLSKANWRIETGAPKWTGEIARFTPDNVTVDGSGHLAITPMRDNREWTSGRIETVRSDFSYPPGGTLRVEAALRLPQVSEVDGKGYWPAFWMMGAPIRDNGNTGWPTWGEIDIMEQVNGQGSVYAATHSGSLPTPTDVKSQPRPCPDCAKGFHVYAMELSADGVRFFVDGEEHHSVPKSAFSKSAHGFFLILNVALGGFWPGAPDKSTVDGKPLLVDYVAVYTRPRSSR